MSYISMFRDFIQEMAEQQKLLESQTWTPGVSNQEVIDQMNAKGGSTPIPKAEVKPVDTDTPKAGWTSNMGGSEGIHKDLADPKKKDEVKQGYHRQGVGVAKTTVDKDVATKTSVEGTDGGVHIARGKTTKTGTTESTSATGVSLTKKAGVSHRVSEVRARNAEGEATDANSAEGTVGIGGVGVKQSRTQGDVTRGNELNVGRNGVDYGHSYKKGDVTTKGNVSISKDQIGAGGSIGQQKGDKKGYSAGANVAIGKDGYQLDLKAGKGPVSASASYKSMNDKEIASWDSADSQMGQLLGGPLATFGLFDGEAMSGKLGVSNGTFGASVSAGRQKSSSVQVHTTSANLVESLKKDPEALYRFAPALGMAGLPMTNLTAENLEKLAEANPDAYRELVSTQMKKKVKGVDSLDDLDVDAMAAGEAYTLRSGEGWNAALGVTAFAVSASLGLENQEAEQTTLSHTGPETWRVDMKAMSADALKAGIGIEDVIDVGLTDTDTDSSDLSFEFNGPEGLKALKEFQTTGLLPGADKVVKDDKALEAFQKAKAAYEADLAADMMWGPDPKLAEEMRRCATALNAKMLKDESFGLSEANVPGVTYKNKRITKTEDSSTSISLLGLWSWGGGSTHASWNDHYTQGGKDQTSYGTKHDERYYFSANETTNMVANPENAWLMDGEGKRHEIELALFTEQGMNKEQRKSLADIDGVTGIPESIEQAWVNGDWGNELTQARMAMTEEHLKLFKDASARNTDVWKQAAGYANPFVERMRNKNENPYGISYGISSPGASVKDLQDMIFRDQATDVLGPVLEQHGADPKKASSPYLQDSPAETAAIAEIQAKLAKVDGPEKFNELTEAEQTLHLTAYAMQAIENDGDPWNAMSMALQVKDPDVRNRHMRKLFHVIEKRREDTHAMTDFIKHIQTAPYLEADERKALLNTVDVNLKDDRVDSRAKALSGKIERGEDAAGYIANQMLEDSETLRDHSMDKLSGMGFQGGMYGQIADIQRKKSGDATVDWLQAAEKAGGSALLDQVTFQLMARDPGAIVAVYDDLRKTDYLRADLYLEMLGKTQLWGPWAAQKRAQEDAALDAWWSNAVD